jgi:hypothetical protein
MNQFYAPVDQNGRDQAALPMHEPDESPAVKAKLRELQSWTLSYNREMLRMTRELNELRANTAKRDHAA